MNRKSKKSGQKKSFSTRYHELLDRIGQHFKLNFIKRIDNARGVRLWIAEWALLVFIVFILAIVQNIWYGESYKTTAFSNGGDYSEATLGEIKSLNPLYATTNSEKTLAKLLFANLVSPDESGNEKCELAKSVTADETNKVWTLVLRDNLAWSDGEPIVADDVIYTIGLIEDASAKTTTTVDFTNVKVEKIDDKTVRFTLPSIYPDFLDNLEFPLLPYHILKDISPSLVYESDYSSDPIGSGPFVFNAMQTNNGASDYIDVLYLKRNEKYFLTKTKLDTFTIKTYDNLEKIAEAVSNSDVSGTAELDDSYDFSNSIMKRTSLMNGGVYAFFNTESEKLSQVKMRQAIRYGINMSEVRSDIDEAEQLDYPILASMDGGLTYPELQSNDMEKARDLIESIGCSYNEEGKIVDKDGEIVSINISVQDRSKIKNVAEKFAAQLNAMGFTAVLNVYDESQNASSFFTAVVRQRDYDILFYEVDLGVSTDPFVYYSSTQANSNGWNFSNYNNRLVDDMLLSARTTTNQKLRTAKYNAFLQKWIEEVPAIGIYRSTMTYYYARNVEVYSGNTILTDALDRFVDVRYWASEKRTVNITP